MRTSNGFGSSAALPGQDQQVNITVKQKALNFQMQARPGLVVLKKDGPAGKRASINLQRPPEYAAGAAQPSMAAIRKGIQTAPKGSNKRPSQKPDQVSAMPHHPQRKQLAYYQQALNR